MRIKKFLSWLPLFGFLLFKCSSHLLSTCYTESTVPGTFTWIMLQTQQPSTQASDPHFRIWKQRYRGDKWLLKIKYQQVMEPEFKIRSVCQKDQCSFPWPPAVLIMPWELCCSVSWVRWWALWLVECAIHLQCGFSWKHRCSPFLHTLTSLINEMSLFSWEFFLACFFRPSALFYSC